jgi:hypothetical protein
LPFTSAYPKPPPEFAQTLNDFQERRALLTPAFQLLHQQAKNVLKNMGTLLEEATDKASRFL